MATKAFIRARRARVAPWPVIRRPASGSSCSNEASVSPPWSDRSSWAASARRGRHPRRAWPPGYARTGSDTAATSAVSPGDPTSPTGGLDLRSSSTDASGTAILGAGAPRLLSATASFGRASSPRMWRVTPPAAPKSSNSVSRRSRFGSARPRSRRCSIGSSHRSSPLGTPRRGRAIGRGPRLRRRMARIHPSPGLAL